MDENQITDRREGGSPEPAITTQPTARPADVPASVAAPPRRKWRWWMPVGVLVVMGGLIAFIQYSDRFPGDAAIRSFATQAACALTVLLLGLWYVFFTGLRWRTRLLLTGVGALLIAAFFAAVRFDGASGDMDFRWRWRWAPPPDADLPKLSDAPLATGRDVTIRPGDFPQFLGPDRNAIVHGVYLDRDWTAHPPREVWRLSPDVAPRVGIGAGWSAFAVAGDLIVTQEQRGDDELIVARDRATGEPVWSHGNRTRFSEGMGGDGPRATPTIAGGKVFALGATGILDCLDGATGKLLWTHDTLKESGESNLQWGKSCSPLVIDDLGLVVVSLGSGGTGGSLAAYDVKTGDPKWVAGQDKASYASPMLATLAGKRQIVMVSDATVTGHDPGDGAILWEYAWKTAPAKASQPPVLPGDRLLLTAGYGVPGVLLQVKHDGDKWTTEEVWTTGHMRTKFTTPVVRDHYAYGLDDGVLTCIDLDDEGKVAWADRANHYGHGQVLLVEDLLLIQVETPGDVVLVEADPKAFHKLGVLHAFADKTWNNPALAGDRLYLRNDREAACYELATVEKSTAP